MKTRRLGPFEVSAIGLGRMNLSHAYGQPCGDEVAAAPLASEIKHWGEVVRAARIALE